MTVNSKNTNRLIHASSPYLQQHSHNPVDWWEWCDEAFEKAKTEDKLIIISIGYSACHWCHVMAHECFENDETAKLMNENFICIKVDREERPDVDQVYMDAVQLLTGQGGWPLNCITLPDGRPIHGGTYFSKFKWESILEQLSDFYKSDKERALQHATELTSGIKNVEIFSEANSEKMSFEKLSEAINNFKKNFDFQKGGFNWSPKFPLPNNWEMFLQYFHFTNDEVVKSAFHTTLTKMAEGGIFDQVGGGFARYSTDSFWKVPHFEKMLYDNAQLMSLYSFAYQKTNISLYKKVVEQIHEFISRELISIQGFFYSALDADSEGAEGKYYVWRYDELLKLLGDDEILFSLYYSIQPSGNWEHGNNILHKTKTDEEIEKLTGISIIEIQKIINNCNSVLLKDRTKRIHPGLDDKMITSWNALMIKGYADAYKVFGEKKYLSSAMYCADFIIENMMIGKTLYRIYKKGKVTIPAFAEDYAALCEALISLYEASFEEKYLLKAKEILDRSIEYFYDEEKYFFFFKSINDSPLIARKIDIQDNVIPSANSIFAKCLYILGFLFDEESFHKIADKMIISVQENVQKYPVGYSNWIQLLMWMNKGFYQVIVAGKNQQREILKFKRNYMPNGILISHSADSSIPVLKDKPLSNKIKFYVCKDKVCGLPESDARKIIIGPD